ncbi:UPF0739 protein C1orf74 homolog [Denticeps clupeoides]|uniref:Uncharacterized protein n=1 Tax=Denticeps clupeoides TaxID=299321 RepID=A0AAY4ADB3_9TELE|nr:UPF0739 protein C1orf74 homolog [Denticeps clupeoides]
MARPASFIEAARRWLCCGEKKKKKLLPASACLDLAAQLVAVDSGLKAALLYDSNGAGPAQVQRYVEALRDSGLVSAALRTVAIGSNTLVVNARLMPTYLEGVLQQRSLLVVDVCPSREQPALFDLLRGGTQDIVHDVLAYFRMLADAPACETKMGAELYGRWNLCTLFGVLLGYPATYWFDQEQGFDNCLSMTPLSLIKVWSVWQTGDGSRPCCLFSFTIPQVLWSGAEGTVDSWMQRLQERFSLQTAFTDLRISRTTVVLPSVAL